MRARTFLYAEADGCRKVRTKKTNFKAEKSEQESACVHARLSESAEIRQQRVDDGVPARRLKRNEFLYFLPPLVLSSLLAGKS
jgi:hypothetical protein